KQKPRPLGVAVRAELADVLGLSQSFIPEPCARVRPTRTLPPKAGIGRKSKTTELERKRMHPGDRLPRRSRGSQVNSLVRGQSPTECETFPMSLQGICFSRAPPCNALNSMQHV